MSDGLTLPEKLFWIGLTVFGGGLYVVFEHSAWGWLFIVGGAGIMVYGAQSRDVLLRPSLMAKVIIISLLTCGFVAFDYYDRHYKSHTESKTAGHTQRIDGLFIQWGGPEPQCHVIVDGDKLNEWRDRYAIALVCGIDDAATDREREKRIAVSSLYDIRHGHVTLVVPYKGALLDHLNERKRQMIPPPGVSPYAKPLLHFVAWNVAVLLPRDSNPSSITCLEDVQRYGGLIVEAVVAAGQQG